MSCPYAVLQLPQSWHSTAIITNAYLKYVHALDNERSFEAHSLEEKSTDHFGEGESFQDRIEFVHVVPHLVEGDTFIYKKLPISINCIRLEERLDLPS